MTPLRVSELLPSTVRLPFSVAALASVTAALLSSCVPAFAVNVPVPSAVLLPTMILPPSSCVPPV